MAIFGAANAGRILIAVVLVWLLLILFIGGPLLRRNDSDYSAINGENAELILARLSRATSELSALKAQNEELRNLLQNYIPLEVQIKKATNVLNDESHGTQSIETLKQFEETRRKLSFNVNELWHYLRTHFNSSVMNTITEHRNNLLYDINFLEKRDFSLKKKELRDLAALVNKAIKDLQNPKDCSSAKKIVCQLNKGCGFGCQLHHVAYCLITALATGRTLILNSHQWRYASSAIRTKKSVNSRWDLVFKPLSDTCTDDSGSSRGAWRGNDDHMQVIDIPIIDTLRPRPPFLPLAIPEQLSQKLQTLHGAPIAWFIGQIVRFIMRPSPELEDYLNKAKARLKFKTPIVGVHVRRTDKVGTEASYHTLAEYMQFVEDYYNKLELFNERNGVVKKVERNVYLATDEPSIWNSEVKQYEKQGYNFIGDSNIAKTASLSNRYSFDSLKNIILDIWLLSESDHLVCTFSSQVCRLAYELMQTRGVDNKDLKIDWSDAFISLDDIYYFGGQSEHNQIAILSHKAKDKQEIDFKVGDTIGIAGNHWNGFSKGVNRRSQQNGLYPGFKTIEEVKTAYFKAFDEI
ncbi:hypothetical protein B4U80_00085 [Leptotrombidium deliense]|uniref:GT23 domain-containing protein n=1 Tax=Leptotrombidium deliense TaxID=299467 RepID=A0A443S5F6_9ACAR|nr:hypothetical protein B4U80_00085 [Leptotrombidium deliense]